MTYLPPGDAAPAGRYSPVPQPALGPQYGPAQQYDPAQNYVSAQQYIPEQPIVPAPQYVSTQQNNPVGRAAIPMRRGAWILPLLALLTLSAIGGGVGLYLHRQHGISEVEAGQCFTNLEGITDPSQSELLARRVDCAVPHTAEVIAVINRPSEIHEGSILDWPHVSAAGNTLVGASRENSMEEWPEETCTYRFNDYLGEPPDESGFTMLPFPMFLSSTPITDAASLRQALDHSDWKLVCMVGHEPRTGSVRNYAR